MIFDQAEPGPSFLKSNFRRMEHSDILGGNEQKTKHCPLRFGLV